MKILTHIEFRSDRFSALEGEEGPIGPDRWGKKLADFLKAGLNNEGIETTEPIAEDWGWVLKIKDETPAFWVGCGHYQEYNDGYLCFIEPHGPPAWRIFAKMNTITRIAELQRAMDKVLAEGAGIRAKRWWSYEDFNQQLQELSSTRQ